MRAVQLAVLALGLAACDACGSGQRPTPIANAEAARAPKLTVRGLEWLSWGMTLEAFRALQPTFTQYEHSGCYEGEGAFGPRRLHFDYCFDATGLRAVSGTIGSTISPETQGILADVRAELDRAFGKSTETMQWSGTTTEAQIFCMGQSGPYSFCSVRLGPRATH